MKANFTFLLTATLILTQSSLMAQWSTNPTVNTSINTFADIQMRPHGVNDGFDGAIVAWVDERTGTNTDIYAQRVDKDGFLLWEITGKAVCTDAANQDWLQITADGLGGAIIAWTDVRNGNSDIYAQRLDANGNAMWAVNGIAVCLAANNQTNVNVELDVNGDILFTWEDQRSGDMDVYAHKIDINGASIWSANGVPVCTVTGAQKNPHMFSDGSGGAFLAWTDNRAAGDAYAQRLDANGNPLWAGKGLQISNVGNVQLTGIVPSANGAIIYWLEGSILWTSATAQRIDGNGANIWPAAGISITTSATVWVVMLDMVQDGADGATFVWTDTRNGGLDAYVQRINKNGASIAPVGGNPLTGLASSEVYPNLSLPTCPNDEHLILTWEDGRNSSADVFAQKLDTNLNMQWAGNGLALSTNSATQSLLPNSTVTVGAGIITIWRDYRNSSAGDIYCQSADCGGNLGGLLPVKFLEVSATQSNKDVYLQWTTAFEINNDYFDVQRSLGNGEFESIGKVNSNGDASGKQHYRFIDQNAGSGVNQYRLRQVNLDGSFLYSEIATVNVSEKITVTTYPNPTTEQVFINGIPEKDAKKYSVELYDIEGKLIYSSKLNNSLMIDLREMGDGTYILKLRNQQKAANYSSSIIKTS